MNPRRKQEPKRTRGGCSTFIRIKWKRQKDRGGTARMRQYQEHQSVVQIFMPLTHSHNSPLCDKNQYSRSSKCIQKRTCEWKAAPLTNKNTQKKTNAKKQFPLHGRRLNQNQFIGWRHSKRQVLCQEARVRECISKQLHLNENAVNAVEYTANPLKMLSTICISEKRLQL